MENQVALLDTSVLIDYYRKTDKNKTALVKLYKTHQKFVVSVITHYEVHIGASGEQKAFWENFFKDISILPVDIRVSEVAVKIYSDLKKISKLIEMPDLLIAATAIAHDLPCATFNKKHFERIKDLKLAEY